MKLLLKSRTISVDCKYDYVRRGTLHLQSYIYRKLNIIDHTHNIINFFYFCCSILRVSRYVNLMNKTHDLQECSI